ncbi:MAG: addiction module toxin RelE, partial [Candidatus Electrothrix sp. AR5]|nr:addiction module toxin RelE [Candidatus Electrothrix sp. AR5]
MAYNKQMNTVVELPEFIRRAEKLLRDAERERLIQYLAANPEAG